MAPRVHREAFPPLGKKPDKCPSRSSTRAGQVHPVTLVEGASVPLATHHPTQNPQDRHDGYHLPCRLGFLERRFARNRPTKASHCFRLPRDFALSFQAARGNRGQIRQAAHAELPKKSNHTRYPLLPTQLDRWRIGETDYTVRTGIRLNPGPESVRNVQWVTPAPSPPGYPVV